jgi:hypothetical protein
LARSQDDIVVDGTWRKLKVGVFSNGVREGQSEVSDRMLAIVREMLPHATVNSLQVNRNCQCGKHKDAKNSSSTSYVLCFGEFAGGVLCFESAHPGGERFEQRDVWHGPLNSRDFYHWNEEILPVDGKEPMKYSLVAYNRETPYLVRKRAQPTHLRTHLARVRKTMRWLLAFCPHRVKDGRRAC